MNTNQISFVKVALDRSFWRIAKAAASSTFSLRSQRRVGRASGWNRPARLLACASLLFFAGLAGHRASGQSETATESVLYSFCSQANCSDGNGPSSLIQANDGNFYGVAEFGGANSQGTFFMMTPAGALTILYSFCSQGGSKCTDGSNPWTLLQGGDGNFYGVTINGGANAGGTVFKVTPSGSLTTLYSFCSQGGTSCDDGSAPNVLLEGSDGNLYGTTPSGGANAEGTVFKVTPSGAFTTLYNFCSQGGSSCTDGSYPTALLQGSDGNFYGISNGGAGGNGIFFKVTPTGTLSTLYTFCSQGGTDCPYGRLPFALVQGNDGNFYGLTLDGGTGSCSAYGSKQIGCGVAFKLTSSGAFTPLYNFCSQGGTNCTDGGSPLSLVQGSDGNFYGLNLLGGSEAGGNIFELTPSGTVTTLYNFCSSQGGNTCGESNTPPNNPMLQGQDGNFYSDYGAGVNADGAILKLALSPALQAPVQLSFGNNQVDVGQSTTLSWKVLNAGSATMRQCYAFVQGGATGAGTWTGLQTGTATGGVYSGSASITPSAAGTYTYALTCGGVESGSATLTVGAAPMLSISTVSLPNGTVGAMYSETLAAAGGVPPYLWSISSGILPQGLTLNPATGIISGIPTSEGTLSFMAEVRDSESTPQTAYAGLSITVNPAPLPGVMLSPASLTFAAQNTGSTSASQAVTLTNSGGAALNITSIAASGDFAETNNCGASLAASSNCTISVTFTPTAGGTRTGTLTVTDNASGSPQAITLTGTGSTVDVSSTPSSLSISSGGGSASASVQLSAAGGFSGTVNLACAVTYQGSGAANDAPTCSLNPGTEQVSGAGPVTTTLTVSTTAANSARSGNPFLRYGGETLAALLLIFVTPRRRRSALWMVALLGAIFAGFTIGCGGGSSAGGSSGNPGTTTGNYTVTITATSGVVSATLSIPLSVQ